MIRIEGIPIVAARVAVMLKSTNAIEASRPDRSHRMQERQFPKASATARARRPRAITQGCA